MLWSQRGSLLVSRRAAYLLLIHRVHSKVSSPVWLSKGLHLSVSVCVCVCAPLFLCVRTDTKAKEVLRKFWRPSLAFSVRLLGSKRTTWTSKRAFSSMCKKTWSFTLQRKDKGMHAFRSTVHSRRALMESGQGQESDRKILLSNVTNRSFQQEVCPKWIRLY